MEQTTSGAQLQAVDNAITEAANAEAHFRRVAAEAITKQDGVTATEAMDYAAQAKLRKEQLTEYKTQATTARAAPKPLDPKMVNHAKAFLGKHTWYGGPQSPEADSKVLSAVDNSLTAEGWDSATPEYWAELETRAKKYLPHRFEKRGNNTATGEGKKPPVNEGKKPPKQPVSGANNSGRSGSGEGGGYRLSEARVKAMQDSGAWDDPVRKEKMIRKYQEYDREKAAE